MYAALAVRRWALWLLVAVPCSAQDAGTILRRVDAHYNNLRTLQARFVERYAGMGIVREEAGTLLLAKPGRMRWTYDKPIGKVFLMDGKYGWSYTPGDPQAQRIAAKKMDDLRSPLRFLLGHTVLEKELGGVSVNVDDSGFVITGVPSGAGGIRVARLVLHVNTAGAIQSIRLEEAGGASTDFFFSAIKENKPVDAGTFVFTVPAGVSVVEASPPA